MTTQPIQDTAEPIAVLYMQFETGLFRFKVFESGTLWAECQRDVHGKNYSAQQFPYGIAVYHAPVWDLEQLGYIIEQYWHAQGNTGAYDLATSRNPLYHKADGLPSEAVAKQASDQAHTTLAITLGESALLDAYRNFDHWFAALNANDQARVAEMLDARDPHFVDFVISRGLSNQTGAAAKHTTTWSMFTDKEKNELGEALDGWIDRYDQAKAAVAVRAAEASERAAELRRKIDEAF